MKNESFHVYLVTRLLHYPLGIWKKEIDILSPISNSLHLMQHYINTLLNQGLKCLTRHVLLRLTTFDSPYFDVVESYTLVCFLLVTHVN